MMSQELKVGVYVCHCGINIAGTINVKEVVEYSRTLPNVVDDERIHLHVFSARAGPDQRERKERYQPDCSGRLFSFHA